MLVTSQQNQSASLFTETYFKRVSQMMVTNEEYEECETVTSYSNLTNPFCLIPEENVGNHFTKNEVNSDRQIPNRYRLKTKYKENNELQETKIFMVPPVPRESKSRRSLSSQRTWQTISQPSASSMSYTSSTAVSKPHTGIAINTSKSTCSITHQILPKLNTKMLGQSPSVVSSRNSTGVSVPYCESSSTIRSTIISRPSTLGNERTKHISQTHEVKPRGMACQLLARREGRIERGSFCSRTPTKVSAVPLGAGADNVRFKDDTSKRAQTNEITTGGKEENKRKGRIKKSLTSEQRGSTKSGTSDKDSKSSKNGSQGKTKKGQKSKEKSKKLNRKAIYNNLKVLQKKMEEEAKSKKKMEWEKQKLFFYWNCVVSRLRDLQRRNHGLKKKEASLKMEKKDGMFHQNWKIMNSAMLQREECLDQKRAGFRSMIRELRDSHKRQTDWLFKDIQTYVKDTYLVGEKYINDVVGIRMEYTKGLTDTLFEARENMRVLEIEQNAKYGPALEEFEEKIRKLRSRIPIERQERLQKMLAESNAMLVELVNVYTTILHHNFIEVCHTANTLNELKSVERRLEREMSDTEKKHAKIKERTEYLQERISNLRRQVNSGKEARKKLHRVIRDQEVLQNKIDLAYINKEMNYQENTRLNKVLQESSERVDNWYFKVKKDFIKDIILQAAKYEQRASQLLNYNHLVRYLFNVESDFLETIDNFKDHEEFDDQKEGLKVLLGVYRPHTLHDLEKEFEGCTESFTTAIIFFKRRLQQNYMSLDDLHFFIKRRNPLSYLTQVRKEESELKQSMWLTLGSRFGMHHKHQRRTSSLTEVSSQSFKW